MDRVVHPYDCNQRQRFLPSGRNDKRFVIPSGSEGSFIFGYLNGWTESSIPTIVGNCHSEELATKNLILSSRAKAKDLIFF